MKTVSSRHYLAFCVALCLRCCNIRGTESLPSVQWLPLDTYQRGRNRGAVVHGCAETMKCWNSPAKSMGTPLQLLLWFRFICTWSTFICAYLSLCTLGSQTYLQFIYAHVFFLNRLCLSCKWHIPCLHGSMDAVFLGVNIALWGFLPFLSLCANFQ